jgi:uncharacterized protein YqgC (DUF456 family)
MDWIYYLLLAAALVAGLWINLIGLPGLWLMLLCHAAYAWVTGWERYVGWTSIIALAALALVAELAEFVAGAAGSKSVGGSRRSMVGAVVGGILGGIFLTFVPIPVVGTIVGTCLGAFIGAFALESWGTDVPRSACVGLGAAGGRLAGILLKTAFGVVMLIVSLIAAIPAAAAPATTSATSPAAAPASAPIAVEGE